MADYDNLSAVEAQNALEAARRERDIAESQITRADNKAGTLLAIGTFFTITAGVLYESTAHGVWFATFVGITTVIVSACMVIYPRKLNKLNKLNTSEYILTCANDKRGALQYEVAQLSTIKNILVNKYRWLRLTTVMIFVSGILVLLGIILSAA